MAPAGAGAGVLAEAAGPCRRRRRRPPNVSMLAVVGMVVRAYPAILEINAAALSAASPWYPVSFSQPFDVVGEEVAGARRVACPVDQAASQRLPHPRDGQIRPVEAPRRGVLQCLRRFEQLQPRPVVGRSRQQELDHAVLYRPDDLLAGPVVGDALSADIAPEKTDDSRPPAPSTTRRSASSPAPPTAACTTPGAPSIGLLPLPASGPGPKNASTVLGLIERDAALDAVAAVADEGKPPDWTASS